MGTRIFWRPLTFLSRVSDALEFDLPVGDGPAGPEGDETIYCDFSMLTGEGPRYIKRSNRVIYEVVDLDAWMEQGKRRFTAEAVEE